jgi:hypothetical protein
VEHRSIRIGRDAGMLVHVMPTVGV